MKLEKLFAKQVITALQKSGRLVYRVENLIGCGFPDLIVAPMTLIELKAGKNKLSPIQRAWHLAWQGKGGTVYTLWKKSSDHLVVSRETPEGTEIVASADRLSLLMWVF